MSDEAVSSEISSSPSEAQANNNQNTPPAETKLKNNSRTPQSIKTGIISSIAYLLVMSYLLVWDKIFDPSTMHPAIVLLSGLPFIIVPISIFINIIVGGISLVGSVRSHNIKFIGLSLIILFVGVGGAAFYYYSLLCALGGGGELLDNLMAS